MTKGLLFIVSNTQGFKPIAMKKAISYLNAISLSLRSLCLLRFSVVISLQNPGEAIKFAELYISTNFFFLRKTINSI
jgi:hypothetical protein